MKTNITVKAKIDTAPAFTAGSMRGVNAPTPQGTYQPEPKPDTTVSPIQTGQTETHYDEPSARPSIKLGVGKYRPEQKMM